MNKSERQRMQEHKRRRNLRRRQHVISYVNGWQRQFEREQNRLRLFSNFLKSMGGHWGAFRFISQLYRQERRR